MAQLDLLQKYKENKRIFIETGTWQGDGVLQGTSAGFETIYTCDIDPELVERAKSIYSKCPDLHAYNRGGMFNISGCSHHAWIKWMGRFI